MNEILDANKNNNNDDLDLNLRPKFLKEYIGQNDLKNKLEVYIGAAKNRNEVIDHVLLYGPPGLGKTTLAYIISNEMKTKFHLINGPSVERPGDLASILTTLEPGDVLFIDEIHRLTPNIEEILYSAMEDFKLITVAGFGDSATNIEINLPPFTLIGATTRLGNLSSPLRSRFGICEKFDFYSFDELKGIIKRTSKVLKTPIDDKATELIAKRSRGTPRIANRIFKRVRDFANFNKNNLITYKECESALTALKIDNLGLDDIDINYLSTIYFRYNGGPIGLKTIASTIGEEAVNLEDACEPYLIQIDLIQRTPRGRIITEKGKKHLNKYHSNLKNI